MPSSTQRREKKSSDKYPAEKKNKWEGKRIKTEVCQVDIDDKTGNRIDPEVCLVDTDDGTCDAIELEVFQVDTDDETGDRIDPEILQVDRQTKDLPRMIGARRRQPLSPP